MLWSDCPSSFFHNPSVKEFGISYTEHPARIECVEAQRSLKNKIDEWIDALNHNKIFTSIVACFANISAEGSRMWSPDSVTDASTLLLVLTRTEFISALVITNECLYYPRDLTMSLQEQAKDIVQAVSEIKTLKASLKQVRKNVDSYHSRWFETVSKMCNEVGTTPSMPRMWSQVSQSKHTSI